MAHSLSVKIPNYKSFIGMIAASIAGTFAGIFIRLALQAGMPVPLIVAGRLSLAAIILTPFVLRSHRTELAQLTRKDLMIAGFAGFWLALHFVWMVFAIENTSILIVQVIVNTGPIWVAFLEVKFLNTRLTRMVWVASVLTLIGGSVIAIGSGMSEGVGEHALLGAFLALISAIASSIYLTIGRHIRSKVSLIPYIWVVFSAGSITALIIVAATRTAIFGYNADAYFWLLMITLIPQLMGHAGFNYALGYFPATIVAIASQSISVTAPLAAFLIFQEVPIATDLLGSVIIMTGVLLAILRNTRSSSKGKT
jgi:drug/metabolite transporter (DMT)-like permease